MFVTEMVWWLFVWSIGFFHSYRCKVTCESWRVIPVTYSLIGNYYLSAHHYNSNKGSASNLAPSLHPSIADNDPNEGALASVCFCLLTVWLTTKRNKRYWAVEKGDPSFVLNYYKDDRAQKPVQVNQSSIVSSFHSFIHLFNRASQWQLSVTFVYLKMVNATVLPFRWLLQPIIQLLVLMEYGDAYGDGDIH
jgi:hypothetical protein